MLEPDNSFLKKQKEKAYTRIKNSASNYVLMKKFNSAARAGLRELIDEGKIEIIDTAFGKAYALTNR